MVIPRELTAGESVDVTALDLELYAGLLTNAPLETVEGQDTEAVAVPACPIDAKMTTAKRALFGKPPKRPKFYPCTPNTLDVEVIYNYVPDDVKSTADKEILRSRVRKQVSESSFI